MCGADTTGIPPRTRALACTVGRAPLTNGAVTGGIPISVLASGGDAKANAGFGGDIDDARGGVGNECAEDEELTERER